MPCGIHDDCVRNVWHDLPCSLYTHDVRRHVERSKRYDSLELLYDFVRNKRGFLEKLASMQDSVAYSSNL